ncbi:MAG TPA: phosphotransferase [Steroidobacteraceae bacterium]|jgi:aminoglycoside/choline kinase family phosphotransferase|nr:phosphotransferase [Steroidobacteraceae bacterium]
MSHADERFNLVTDWVTRELRLSPRLIEPASSDASFRRYFRVFHEGGTHIVMDAPPGREDVRPYLNITVMLETAGVHVPRVYEWDAERGLLLLEDLGTRQYLPALEAGQDVDQLYRDALQALAHIQVRGRDSAFQLPAYDREVLVREMALMPEWFCARHLQLDLNRGQGEMITAAFEFLVAEALGQPQVFVHRDYHSRNLMITRQRNPGIIDFQDALRGPVGYDLVSLLKDCYISWPRPRVEAWVREYRLMMHTQASHSAGINDAQMLRWFDVIGIQRHLKVLGIFARLWYRDGKCGYLKDLPLTLQYVVDACASFPQLQALREFLQHFAVPALPPANAREVQRAVSA